MTEINKDDNNKTTDDMRAKRRLILKAGAAIAPLAVTLYGGIPLAHAASASCEEKMTNNGFQIPNYDPETGEYTGTITYGHNIHTGRMLNSGMNSGKPETHWDFISIEGNPGHSCFNSLNPNGNEL